MDKKALLNQWRSGLRVAHKAHERTASRFEFRGRWLGVLTVVFTTIVGTSLFADASQSISTSLKVVAGVLSIAAAVLSAIQSSLKYGELAALHRAAAHRYGPLRRECEGLLALAEGGAGPSDEALTEIRKRWDLIENDVPSVPQEIWDRAAAECNRLPSSVASAGTPPR